MNSRPKSTFPTAFRTAAAFWSLAALAACASVIGRRPEDRAVTVSLGVARPTAIRRTLAAMREQGYEVKESLTSGSELTTEPFRHTRGIEATFRAVITGTERSSRVVLSGVYRERQFGGIVEGDEKEITRSDQGVEGELWARLQNLALAIRTPP
jgi:hypothetical protein